MTRRPACYRVRAEARLNQGCQRTRRGKKKEEEGYVLTCTIGGVSKSASRKVTVVMPAAT